MTQKQILNVFRLKFQKCIANCPYKGWEFTTNLLNGRMIVGVSDIYTNKSFTKSLALTSTTSEEDIKDFIHNISTPFEEQHFFSITLNGKDAQLQKVYRKQVKINGFYIDMPIEEVVKLNDALTDASFSFAEVGAEVNIGGISKGITGYEFRKSQSAK